MLHPTRDFYQRELVDLTGERLFLIQRGLARLVEAGVVEQASRGNRVYYRVNQAHPAFQDLKGMILKTVGLSDTLRAQLREVGDRVKVAFLYGSSARGGETAASDIDIMLVGDLSGREVASVFAPVKKMLRREINPSVYSSAEFRKKIKERHPFVTTVLREPKVFLLGDERGLKAILGRRSA
jgi:predicted nucleotidyltransferase